MEDKNTSVEGEVVQGAAAANNDAKKPDTTMAMVIYGLYLASFVLFFGMIVGVVIAYVYRGKGPEWLDEHYRYQIRTFWIACVYGTIAFVLSFLLIGLLVFVFIAIWVIIRCILGFKALQEHRAPNNVNTWFI